ncbi:uncharacterized protein MELLADRAFT_84735 [Melampsora larici-populina 98AG31]|uniref:Uncharacterized protein n=1 Tax=Melampsora larici-populina (strain 98AG31 / pathotype 3-4-7) TaxID=747676 RepID=F4RG34_MELLP|nr:uncharacterized protein MELLADRAFT_84735 [Melampsora larici-populina 98AG31]EGG08537.1 hypothetical protein MELLADRAFT_84735 [Melampsora larici-populina 98AG31]
MKTYRNPKVSYLVPTQSSKYCKIAHLISQILDAVDGQAARSLQQTSRFVAVLDMLIDRMTESRLSLWDEKMGLCPIFYALVDREYV